jgi:hypothetical protein
LPVRLQGQFKQSRVGAGAWQALALAELAGAVAALVLDVKPKGTGARR